MRGNTATGLYFIFTVQADQLLLNNLWLLSENLGLLNSFWYFIFQLHSHLCPMFKNYFKYKNIACIQISSLYDLTMFLICLLSKLIISLNDIAAFSRSARFISDFYIFIYLYSYMSIYVYLYVSIFLYICISIYLLLSMLLYLCDSERLQHFFSQKSIFYSYIITIHNRSRNDF